LEDLSFPFELPQDRIAQRPAQRRGESRLLHVDGERRRDLAFAAIEGEIAPGSVLVLNDTRVLAARLTGEKESGGRIEVLVERVLGTHRALALVRSSHPPRPGMRLLLGEGAGARVLGRQEDLFELEFDEALDGVLARAGRLPLPPYIQHEPDREDLERYQTVYARAPGAVAAPTAGLHFTPELLAALAARGVEVARLTLHVGAGTFQPLRDPDPRKHRMHAERYELPQATADAVNAARRDGRPVVAVGTTSLRTLEACTRDGHTAAGEGETALYILPGYRFGAVDRLLTNFHLPGTTLLLLVCAFGGREAVRAAYGHALEHSYRFFSYGDAMLLERAP